MPKLTSIAELDAFRQVLQQQRDPSLPAVSLCAGSACQACGCLKVADAFRDGLAKAGLEGKVRLLTTGCHGFCEKGPLAVIRPQGIFYQHIQPKDVPEIIARTLQNGEVIDRLLYRDPATKQQIVKELDIPFYKKQTRLIFANNGHIDPENIDDYIFSGGYEGLSKALRMTPSDVIAEVKLANLRGRGGGGFPAGKKWETCRNAPGEIKYVICNADEGDPGAYMDRSLLEGNPHSVIEGMIIGAYAIGSTEGYVYVRHEYPLAVKNLTRAIGQAEENGLLGENILGTDFSLYIKVIKGGGAFVCGESTALMASIEGKVGEPRAKYVHTVEHGLWGRPSNLNNVETWANVPYVIRNGADWFKSFGTAGSPGTKVFSLVGKINNTGLVEVPMGITIREILYDIGGGITGKKKFKAVQTGGPSGGAILVEKFTGMQRESLVQPDTVKGAHAMLPESFIDLPVDFDSLWEFTDVHGVTHRLHSMMGSGGMIVMDQDTCMVDMARYYMNFLREESCGKCTPCREGIRQMLDILNRICSGTGQPGDIDMLWEIGEVLEDSSLCGLGTTAANPVLSTIKFFHEEYDAHIAGHFCPAGVCKSLLTYGILADKCTGCTICRLKCPEGAITGEKKQPHVLDTGKCVKCGICYDVCRFDAITKAAHRLTGAQAPTP